VDYDINVNPYMLKKSGNKNFNDNMLQISLLRVTNLENENLDSPKITLEIMKQSTINQFSQNNKIFNKVKNS